MTAITDFADKIEAQLALYDSLGGTFRFTMTSDAARAYVEQLRATEQAVAEIERLRAALTEISNCYVEKFGGEILGLKSNTPLSKPGKIARAALSSHKGG